LKIINAGLICLAACAFASPASAQMTWTDKGFVNANVGFQLGSQDFTVATPFEIYNEPGTVTSTMDVKGGGFFDVSAGYKVWRNLAVGIGYTFTDGSTDAAVTASVPDPLFFDQPRTVTATGSGVGHTEQQIHLTGTWMIPVTDKIDVGLAFGPTIFSVKQDIPNGVDVTEPGPTVTRVNAGSVDETAVGIHLGVDVTYLITPRIGVGGLARYTRGSVEVENASENLKAGGFQIGAGVRFRF
jgi:opacity protein-like surface antigen